MESGSELIRSGVISFFISVYKEAEIFLYRWLNLELFGFGGADFGSRKNHSSLCPGLESEFKDINSWQSAVSEIQRE